MAGRLFLWALLVDSTAGHPMPCPASNALLGMQSRGRLRDFGHRPSRDAQVVCKVMNKGKLVEFGAWRARSSGATLFFATIVARRIRECL